MLHDNNTPYAAIGFEQWHRDGATMACVAARADMVFGEDGKIKLAETQEIVLADEFSGDPQKKTLIRPSDLTPFKPNTDITFLGSMFSPNGEPRPSLSGSITLGNISANIRGCGPREWVADGDSWVLSDPEPIMHLPLCYTKASGGRMIGEPDGTVDPRNPIGCNLIDLEFTPKGRNYPAAQIDTQAHPIHNDFTRPPLPQGFGPMAPWWRSRECFAGTYDDAWKKNTHPRLPADFDYSFYNISHPELQAKGFLSGGETVELTNLTPSGYFAFRLPNSTPYARFSYTDGREVLVPLNLDGVHIDFRAEPYSYSLTWRAWIDICPAFYRVDLEGGTLEEVRSMGLPIACETGLMEGK